jgi:hypothetical protein
MPQQPVMAARGGSIDQLMSNLGSHYAGGGIIAFDEGGDVEEDDNEERIRKSRMASFGMPVEQLYAMLSKIPSIPSKVAEIKLSAESFFTFPKREGILLWQEINESWYLLLSALLVLF